MLSDKYSEFKDWLLEVDEGSAKRRVGSNHGNGNSPSNPEGIAHLNSDGVITYVDDDYLDFLDYGGADELMGKHLKQVYGKEADKLERKIKRRLQPGETWQGEVTGTGGNGATVSHKLSVTKTAEGGAICRINELSAREEVEIIEEKRKQVLKALKEGTAQLQDSPTRYDIYNTALKALRDALDLDFCAMNVEDDDLCLVKGQTDGLSKNGYNLYGCIERLSEKAMTRGEVIWGNELNSILESSNHSENIKSYSYISVPIEETGVIEVFSSGEKAFSELDRDLMEIIGRHLYERITRAQLEGDLKNQAIHDQLTGLYNRHYFHKLLPKEVERSQRYGHSITFLMIDINDFKDVNDRYSHTTGDQVLVQIAEIIRDNVREPDTVIRYGGDEFLVVMPETGRGSEIVVERLNERTKSWSQETELIDFPLTLAIGAARYAPDGEQPAKEVVKQADQRMYEDKRSQTV
ncbi:MAG: diguanylate cyclase [Candidatus Acetothermia bacterium]